MKCPSAKAFCRYWNSRRKFNNTAKSKRFGWIGALSNVETDALRFSFDVVMQGSLADHARLEIIEVPGQAWCMPCSRNVVVQQLYDLCPHCGSHQLQVNSGDQMRIKELEVE